MRIIASVSFEAHGVHAPQEKVSKGKRETTSVPLKSNASEAAIPLLENNYFHGMRRWHMCTGDTSLCVHCAWLIMGKLSYSPKWGPFTTTGAAHYLLAKLNTFSLIKSFKMINILASWLPGEITHMGMAFEDEWYVCQAGHRICG